MPTISRPPCPSVNEPAPLLLGGLMEILEQAKMAASLLPPRDHASPLPEFLYGRPDAESRRRSLEPVASGGQQMPSPVPAAAERPRKRPRLEYLGALREFVLAMKPFARAIAGPMGVAMAFRADPVSAPFTLPPKNRDIAKQVKKIFAKIDAERAKLIRVRTDDTAARKTKPES